MRKEKLEVNKDKKIKTSKWKNVLLSGVLAATLLSGCGDGKGIIKNKDKELTKTEQTKIGQTDTQNASETLFTSDERSKCDCVIDEYYSGYYIYENPETMKLFVVIDHPNTYEVHGREHTPREHYTPDTKLSEEFDDIEDVTRIGDTVYYIGINGGKKALYKNKEKLYEGNNIEYFVIDNTAIIVADNNGKTIVRWGDNTICDDCSGVHYLGGGISIQKGGKTEVYINGNLGFTVNGSLKHAHLYNSGNGHYVLIDGGYQPSKVNRGWYDGTRVFIDGELVASNAKVEYLDNNEGCTLVKITKSNGKTIFIDAKTGQKIGGEYDDTGSYRDGEDGQVRVENIFYYENNNTLVILTSKNGKAVYVINGEDYEILGDEYAYEPNGKVLRKGDTLYYIVFSNMVKLGEYNYKSIEQVGKTSEGKYYFIGKKGNKEDFVIDGKVMGKDLDHISGAGLIKGGGVYVRGEKGGKKYL